MSSKAASSASASAGAFWEKYKKPISIGVGVAIVIALIWYFTSGRTEGFAGSQQQRMVGGYPQGYSRYPMEGFYGPMSQNQQGQEGFYDGVPVPPVAQDAAAAASGASEPTTTGGGSGKRVILFYAPWCPHCQRIEPTWDELAAQFNGQGGLTIEKINCDEKPEAATQYGIGGFPTIIMFNGGKTTTYDGDRSKEDLVKFLSSN